MLGTLNNIKINIFSDPVVIKWTVSVRDNILIIINSLVSVIRCLDIFNIIILWLVCFLNRVPHRKKQHCKSFNGIAGQLKTGIFPLTIWVCYVKVLVSKIITTCESDLTVNYGNFSVITVIHEHIKCKLNRIEYAAVNTIGTHFFDEILVKEEDTSYIIIE